MSLLRDDGLEVPEFHIRVDRASQPPCVYVSGELDLVTCAAFRDALADAHAANPRHIAIDVTNVTFLGSTGIREITRLLPRVDRIEVRQPSRAVRAVLDMIELGAQVVVVEAPASTAQ